MRRLIMDPELQEIRDRINQSPDNIDTVMEALRESVPELATAIEQGRIDLFAVIHEIRIHSRMMREGDSQEEGMQ